MLLLFRGFRRNRVPLLLWSGLCFAALAINSVLVIADFIVFPLHNLSAFRSTVMLAGLLLLLYGLIWEKA